MFLRNGIIMAVAVVAFATQTVPAHAVTLEELQALILQLTERITALEGSDTTDSATDTAVSAVYTFTRSLEVGTEGTDVIALQEYLISAGFSIPAGATGYFGPQTKAAVAAWQSAHSVAPAVGYFGPVSRAKYAELTASVAAEKTTVDTEEVADEVTLTGSNGDLSFDNDTLGLQSEIHPGTITKVEALRIQAEDSDAALTKVRVAITPNTNSASGATGKLDAYVDTVHLYLDDVEVGTATADEFTESDDVYSTYISVSDAIIYKGKTNEALFAIGIEGPETVDSGDVNAEMTVAVTKVRFVDAEEQVYTKDVTASDGETTGITITQSAVEEGLVLGLAPENPAEGPLGLYETQSTDITPLIFTMKAVGTDITVGSVDATIELDDVAGSPVIATAYYIYHGDTRIADIATSSVAGTENLTFNFYEDQVIKAGTTETYKLVVKATRGDETGMNGATITATIDNTSSDIDAENPAGESVTNLSGVAAGNEQTIGYLGLGPVGFSYEVTPITDASGDIVKQLFTVEFIVAASADTMYISNGIGNATTTTDGATFVTQTNGTIVGSEITSTDARLVNDRFEIPPGELVHLKASLVLTATSTGFYNVRLSSLNYGLSSTGNLIAHSYPIPQPVYTTEDVYID